MTKRAVIDTNVFIYAFEFPDSNSAKIIELITTGELEPFITQTVLKEVTEYFKTHHNKKLADEFRYYLLEVCKIVYKDEIKKEMRQNKNKINNKDLEQIAAAKHLHLKLLSYDRDFEKFDEYATPREFVKSLEKKPAATKF